MDFEARFRNKITFIQFLLSIGIVYQHTVWNYSGSMVLNTLQSFLFYLLETCVPFFFMISGYLFFRTYSPSKAKMKIVSRMRTLLIPYLIWNTLYALFIIGLTRLGLIHNSTIDGDIGGILLQLINAEFSPLWFVKYLMVFSLIAPFFYYLLRRKIVGIITIFIMVILNAFFYYSGIMQTPLNVNSNSVVMLNYQYIFYAVGAYGALNCSQFVEKPTPKKRKVASIILFTLIACYFLYIIKHSNVLIGHSFRLLYVIAVWFAIDYILRYRVYKWMNNSFFIYCSHLIVLQCVQRVCDILIGKIAGTTSVLYVIEYIFLPLIVSICLIAVAEKMKKNLPSVYGVLTGNRG